MVLDLGSGGGIDVLLSARRVGPAGKAYAVALPTTVAAVIAAATSRHSYRRTWLGGADALTIVVVLDAAMIGAVAVLAPTLV
jgi:hypothetical protein